MSEMQKYDTAVKAIKTAILQSQYEAARSVNEKSDCGNSNLAVATAELADESFWQMRLPKTLDFPLDGFLKMGFTQHIAVLAKVKAMPAVEDLRRLLDGDKEGGVNNERD